VQLLEHGDQSPIVNDLVLGRERLARAQLFEDVVHAGDGEIGVRGLLLLAVGVQLLGEVADACLPGCRSHWEWELLKAVSLHVDRAVFKEATGRKTPDDMDVR